MLQQRPQESLAWISCPASDQFLLTGKGQAPWSVTNVVVPDTGQLSLSGERIWVPPWTPYAASHGWQVSISTSCFSITKAKSAFQHPRASVSSLGQCFPLSPCPFSFIILPLSLSLSWNLSASHSVLSIWKSGCGAAIASLFSAQPTHLEGRQAEVGRAHFISCRPWSRGSTDQRLERDTGSNLICVAAQSPSILIVSPLFPAAKRSPIGDGLKQQISVHWCICERPSCGWESHMWWTTGWFSGLVHLGGQWTACSLLHWPFLEVCSWCLNKHWQGVGCNGTLSLCLIFSLFCPSCLYLSLGPHPYTPVLFILKTSCLCL